MTLYGVTVRWSLHAMPGDVAEQLRQHVSDIARAEPPPDPELYQVMWTMRLGGSFGATSVWTSATARAAFVERLRAQGSPVARLLGHRADTVEEFEVVAVVPGATSSAESSTAPGELPSSQPRDR